MENIVNDFDEITPADGRDYTSKAKVLADYNAGKDFILARTGQRMSKRDVPAGIRVMLRYSRLMKVVVV